MTISAKPAREEARRVLLIVEDDRHTRAFLSENLRADGFEPLAAASSPEAMRVLTTRDLDLAIISLQDTEALDLVKQVRAADGEAVRFDPQMPLLVLSPFAGQRDRLVAHGVDAVLATPFSYPELRACVGALLRAGRPGSEERWCSCGAGIGHNAVLCVDCTLLLEEEVERHRAWSAREPERCAALAQVLEAAERRSRELLDQASVYERKGMQPIADETLNQHYRPLKDAIEALRGDVVIVSRDVAEEAAALIEASSVARERRETCAAVTHALRGDDDAARRTRDED